MIDGRLLRRLLGGAGLLHVFAALVAFGLGRSSFGLGLLLGYVLGAIPFASWAWIASRGMSSTRAKVLAVLLLLGKMGLYAGLLYLLVTREVASPLAVMIGITAVGGVLCAGSLMAPSAPSGPAAKEASRC